MVEKYIIDKIDIHDLLTGKELPLQQGKARAFCVEIAGKITNGDMIEALFPHYEIETKKGVVWVHGLGFDGGWQRFLEDWWNAPYKTESEGNE